MIVDSEKSFNASSWDMPFLIREGQRMELQLSYPTIIDK